MLIKLPFLLLLALCSAQDLDSVISQTSDVTVSPDELKQRIDRIFNKGIASSTPPPEPTASNGVTISPEELRKRIISIFAQAGSTDTCTTENGAAGVCVKHTLCNKHNKNGKGIIDIRISQCGSYFLTCCAESDIRRDDDPITFAPEPNEAYRKGCGWRNPKGVGIRTTGESNGETKFAEFPWMCAIMRLEPESHMKVNVYIGGGSLIHPSVVLTAAHTVSLDQEMRVRAGEWDTQITREPFPYQDREVATVEIHRDFNNESLFYDVALLFLTKPMHLAPNVQPACLPPPKTRLDAGTRCFATGWGKDKFDSGNYQVIMKKVEVPVVDQNKCLTQLRKTALESYFELHHTFMCAGGELGKDVCTGDGGAPLSCPIADDPGRFVQTGIVSWGIGCGLEGVPGVYVDVSRVRQWIDDKVAGKGYEISTYSYIS